MKFGLLRALATSTPLLNFGVNWYLTGDETHNSDGKHVTYLEPNTAHHSSWRSCDPDLMARLASVVATDRSVAALDAARVLPAGSAIYSARLVDGMSSAGRRAWHAGALEALSRATSSSSIRTTAFGPNLGPKASKFAFPPELADYGASGQSLVIYHHADRSPGGRLDPGSPAPRRTRCGDRRRPPGGRDRSAWQHPLLLHSAGPGP